MALHDHNISLATLSRLLPSDIVRVSELIPSSEFRKNLVSTVKRYFMEFQKPSATDLSQLYKVISQLNTAGFWKYVDPKQFINSIKTKVPDEVLLTIMEALGVESDEPTDRRTRMYSKRSVRRRKYNLVTTENEPQEVRGAPIGLFRRGIKKETETVKGTVKWFDPQKGFGYIEPDDGGPNLFVHISAVERAGMTTLANKQKVTVVIKPDRKGRSVHLVQGGSGHRGHRTAKRD